MPWCTGIIRAEGIRAPRTTEHPEPRNQRPLIFFHNMTIDRMLPGIKVRLLFLLAAFFSPIAGVIPPIATAPALIIVGALMIGAVTSIKWEDLTEAIPAFLTMLAMPLTFSIANGLALGFIFYPLLKVLTGRWREASPLVYVLAVLFALRYFYLGAE